MSVKITKDGRTILSGKDYAALRRLVWHRQRMQCRECSRRIELYAMHLHHGGGRGLGGCKRDDVAWFQVSKATGKPGRCVGLCGDCHGEKSPGWRKSAVE